MSIITRQRKKKRSVRGLLLPVVAIALLVAAIFWPPSRSWFQNGPLHPIWALTGAGWNVVAQPLHWAAQNQLIADKNRELRRLNALLDAQRAEVASKDERIKSVENQMKATLASIANATPTPGPGAQGPQGPPGAPGAPGASAPQQVAVSGSSSSEIARTAAYWNSMDPEKAAAVVKKLPVEYVSKVFAKMPSDQVAEIMNSLPPSDAAKFAGAVPIAQ